MPTSKKSTRKTQRYTIMLVAFLAVAVVVFVAIGLFLRGSTPYVPPDKSAIEQSARQVMDSLASQEVPVYSDFVDDGCVRNDIGWLGSQTTCSFVGDKYLRASGDALPPLQTLDANLRKLGMTMQIDQLQGSTPQQPEDILKELAASKQRGTMRYQSAEGLTTFLYLFKADANSSVSVKDYLGLPATISLAPDEFIYGIKVKAPYWSCSQSCPDSPSPARKQ